MLHELVDLDVAVVVLVALLEELVHNLLSVVLVHALVGQKEVHLLLVNAAVAVNIDGAKFLPKFAVVLIRSILLPRLHFQIN